MTTQFRGGVAGIPPARFDSAALTGDNPRDGTSPRRVQLAVGKVNVDRFSLHDRKRL